MYEITYENEEKGKWKLLVTWSNTFRAFIDEEGFEMRTENAIWINKL